MSSVVAVVDVGVVDFVFANNWATPDSDQNFFFGGGRREGHSSKSTRTKQLLLEQLVPTNAFFGQCYGQANKIKATNSIIDILQTAQLIHRPHI